MNCTPQKVHSFINLDRPSNQVRNELASWVEKYVEADQKNLASPSGVEPEIQA